jgi:hypothetical protein
MVVKKKLGGKLKNSNNHGGSAPNLATKETVVKGEKIS